ncbi:MAG: tRNA uracil 4-sulfurtransferase ThiI [Bacilli bacterium]
MDKISILIKYGELTLKGKNVADFKNLLYKNIKNALKDYNCDVTLAYSRIYVEIDKKDFEEVSNKLLKIYGIHSFAPYVACENDLEVIKEKTLEYVSSLEYATFKVETKRKNKKFETTSTEVSRQVGGYVRAHSDMEVDVHNPSLKINIEIRNSECLIYFDEYQALGGLPVGISGKALLLLSGGIDSPIAGYMINKRGLKFDALHFTSPPYTSKESVDKVFDLCDKLALYNGEFNLFLVKFTKVQEQLLELSKNSYFITIMRRIMYRIADMLCEDKNYNAIINGDSIGQVASQTLYSMKTVDMIVESPIIRPLAVFDKSEIVKIAKEIETYDISIRAFEDCCTVFVPKSPIIKPKSYVCESLEKEINLKELIYDCLENIEVIKITTSSKKFESLL